jgi:superfamily II DNA/RNA helicase
MSLQPRTAAPGKARRAASAGKPRTKKNAAKSPKSTFNPIDKEVRAVKKEAPKTTRRYSDGPKGTPTRKEERNLERSKLRAKRYQEKIAPKAKTTSRADEFVAKRTERTERPEKTERTFKKTEYRSGEYKKTTFKKSDKKSEFKKPDYKQSDTRPTTRREAAKADPANDGRPNFVPQKRTKWIPGQKPRKPETERPDTTRANNRGEKTFKPRSTTDSRTVNKTYGGKKSTTAYPRTHTREAVDFGANDKYITEEVIETKSRKSTSASATLTDTDITWTQLGISAPLVNALSAQGITSPFPIQIATLPDALKGHDILGRGQTGSGKTLAFGLALLNNLQNKQAKPHKPLALVLTPTRELAQQIDEVLTPLARAIGHESVVIAGGMPYAKQITAMRKAVAILVATPGRLIDLLNRGEVQLDNLEITVLDEADQMADMGFLPVVKEILDQGKMGGQRLLFSATLDRGVDSLVKSYLKNPKTHSLQNDRASVSTMDHHVLVMHPGDKDLITAQIAARNGKTILFVKTQRGADRLADNLAKAGVPVGALHGGKSQAVRTRTLKLFKEQENAALVATDVAARGIHVDGISLVVHVDAPTDHKDYLHRSGRTARAGEAGGVVVLATTKQQTSVKGLTSRAGVTPKFVGVKPNDAELMTITGAQEPSGIPYIAPITESRGPARSGGKRPRPNSSQRRRRPR